MQYQKIEKFQNKAVKNWFQNFTETFQAIDVLRV